MSNNPFEDLAARLDRIESLLTVRPALPISTVEKPITTKELCEFLGVTEPTIIRWRKRGVIPFLLIGSSVRYDKAGVISALEKTSKQNNKTTQ